MLGVGWVGEVKKRIRNISLSEGLQNQKLQLVDVCVKNLPVENDLSSSEKFQKCP